MERDRDCVMIGRTYIKISLAHMVNEGGMSHTHIRSLYGSHLLSRIKNKSWCCRNGHTLKFM